MFNIFVYTMKTNSKYACKDVKKIKGESTCKVSDTS